MSSGLGLNAAGEASDIVCGVKTRNVQSATRKRPRCEKWCAVAIEKQLLGILCAPSLTLSDGSARTLEAQAVRELRLLRFRRPQATFALLCTGWTLMQGIRLPHPGPGADRDVLMECDRIDIRPTLYSRREPCSVRCETILAQDNLP